MSTENTQPSQAPESTEEKAKKPVPEEFFRQPYSFVRRGDRLTARRQKAWDRTSRVWGGCGGWRDAELAGSMPV